MVVTMTMRTFHIVKGSGPQLYTHFLMNFFSLLLFFQIIVLESGKVVEQGPHEVLLSKAGRYAQLWGQQNNSEGLDAAI